MKHLSRIFSLLVLVSAAVFFANCGGDGGGDGETEEEKQLAALAGTWNITNATFDGATKAEFASSTLTLTAGKTFSFSKGSSAIAASPWPSSGTFVFGTNIESNIVFKHSNGDEIAATYSLSGNNLTITIADYEGENYPHARPASVAGDWVFTLTK